VEALPPKNQKSLRAAAALIRQGHFDEIYILPRSVRTGLEAWLAKIPRRIGFGGDGRRFFLTEAHDYEHRLLYAHRYLSLINEGNLPAEELEPYFPSVPPAPAPDLKKPLLGIGPSSVAPSRTWFPDRFAEVANRFIEKTGGSVILFGSPAEREVSARVQSQIKGPVPPVFSISDWRPRQSDPETTCATAPRKKGRYREAVF
jgi:heptosyltransferase-2